MTHREFYQLCEKIKDMEDFVKQLKAERDEAAEELMEQWMETGETQVKCDGRCIHLHNRTYAKKLASDEEVYAALRASGHGALIKDNVPANTLAATIREELETNEELPPEWDGIIEAGHIYSIRVRKA